MTALLRVDRALMAPGPSQRLILAHRLLAAALVFRLVERPWWRAGARPDALFEPVWIISWLDRPPSTILLVAIQATGVQKLRHSGLTWVTSDNMAWVVRQGTSIVGSGLNTTVGRQVGLLSFIAGTALVFELAAPILVGFRRTRVLVPVLSLTMHASIWVLLGLDYSSWILAVLSVTVPFVIRWDAAEPDAPWWRRIDLPWRLTPTSS